MELRGQELRQLLGDAPRAGPEEEASPPSASAAGLEAFGHHPVPDDPGRPVGGHDPGRVDAPPAVRPLSAPPFLLRAWLPFLTAIPSALVGHTRVMPYCEKLYKYKIVVS